MFCPERMSHTLAFLSQPCWRARKNACKQTQSKKMLLLSCLKLKIKLSPRRWKCFPSQMGWNPGTKHQLCDRGNSATAAHSPHPTGHMCRRHWRSGSDTHTHTHPATTVLCIHFYNQYKHFNILWLFPLKNDLVVLSMWFQHGISQFKNSSRTWKSPEMGRNWLSFIWTVGRKQKII